MRYLAWCWVPVFALLMLPLAGCSSTTTAAREAQRVRPAREASVALAALLAHRAQYTAQFRGTRR